MENGSTPRTDQLYEDHGGRKFKRESAYYSLIDHARQLERDLSAANLRGENLHAKLRETEAALIEARAQRDRLQERVSQFDSAIQRIATSVGAVCGGVDTEGDGPGGHTAAEIVRKIGMLNAQRDEALEKLAFCKAAHAELVRLAGGPPPPGMMTGDLKHAAPAETSTMPQEAESAKTVTTGGDAVPSQAQCTAPAAAVPPATVADEAKDDPVAAWYDWRAANPDGSIYECFIAAYAQGERKGMLRAWIPVNIQPAIGQDILAYCGWCITATFRHKNASKPTLTDWHTEDGMNPIFNVTYWMPLPAAPITTAAEQLGKRAE